MWLVKGFMFIGNNKEYLKVVIVVYNNNNNIKIVIYLF